MKRKFPNAWKQGLVLSLLLISGYLTLNLVSWLFSGSNFSSSRAPVQKTTAAKPKVPSFPINFCKDAQSVQLDDSYNKAVIESFSYCGSKVVFVPFDQKFKIKANEPGITKVCFWLNGRCAAIRAIRNSDNLELGANLPARSALRFSSSPPGTVTVQLIDY